MPMFGKSLVTLASATLRVAEAKAQIESRNAMRYALLRRGQVDAAGTLALRIRDLRQDLKYSEAVLLSVRAQSKLPVDLAS